MMDNIRQNKTSIRLEEIMAKKPTRKNEIVEEKTIGLTESNFFDGFCEDLIGVIHRQDDYIQGLLKQLGTYEEELYQKDLTILRLENKVLNIKYQPVEEIIHVREVK
jgi:hypothetical protein